MIDRLPSLQSATPPPPFEIPPELYRLPGFHEPFSSMSHLFGAVLFLYLGALVIRRGWGDRVRVICLSVYAFSCVFLMSMSGVYHMMVRGGAAHQVMARLDHGAIFMLIAGTFTPAHGILFRGFLRWGVLLLMWTAAIAGIVLKTVFFTSVPYWVGLSFYLALGWFGAVSGYFLAHRYGWRFIMPLVYGGIAYSLGGVIDHWGWFLLVPGVIHPHEVFHILVLCGALFHWWFVWGIADGRVPVEEEPAKELSGMF